MQLKKTYGDELVLMGNVDVDLLGRGTPEEVAREVRRLIDGVAPGDHVVTFVLGRHPEQTESITVTADEMVTLEVVVDWPLSYFDTLTVSSMSRRPERIVEGAGAEDILAGPAAAGAEAAPEDAGAPAGEPVDAGSEAPSEPAP